MKLKKWIALGLAAAVALSTAACGADPNKVLVEVGKGDTKVDITEGQLDQYVKLNAYLQGVPDISQLPKESLPAIRSNILENMIDVELVKMYYADKKDKILTDDFDKQKKEAIDSFKKATDSAIFLKNSGVTEQTLDDYLVQNAYLMALYDEMDKALPANYTEEKVTASHILLTTNKYPDDKEKNEKYDEEQKKKAEDIYNQLINGADFATLAKKYSEDPGSAEKGGDLGTFGKGVMVPEFEKVAFSITPGAISKPFKSQFGYHIVKVAKREEVTTPVSQLDQTTKGKLMNEKLVQKIQELRDQYGVTYLDKNMEKAAKEAAAKQAENK